MALSRRRLLVAGGLGAVAAGLDVGLAGPAEAGSPPPRPVNPPTGGNTTFPPPTAPVPTTVDTVVLPGTDVGAGYRQLVEVGGEGHTVLRDLTSVLTHPTYALGCFVHFSDLHLVDHQSPARVEFLDRFANLGAPHFGSYPFDSAYRPHELLSTHLTHAMVMAIHSLGRGPRTHLPFAFTIVTGDMTDNCQYNETRWYMDLLDGGKPIRADSGQIGVDESVYSYLAPGNPSGIHDPAYWFPEDSRPDAYKVQGFPTVPGLMAAARRPYQAVGLNTPWYAAYGNHDGEVQGYVPQDPGFFSIDNLQQIWTGDPRDVAVQGTKIVGSAVELPDLYSNFGLSDKLALARNLEFVSVTPDGDRRLLDRFGFTQEHFNTTGTPNGHGFTANSGLAYYTIPSSDTDLVQYITLDTVNTAGGSDGFVDDIQFAWLENLLKANSSRYLSDAANPAIVTQAGVRDKLFVLFCHHTLASLNNTAGNTRQQPPRGTPTGPPVFETRGKYSADLQRLLLRYPNVILLANGHTHKNKIEAFARPAGWPIPGGFWQVSTPSHIDWPIQSRIIELAAGRGTISIFTTAVDILATAVAPSDLPSPSALASLARELAVNDPTERGTDSAHPQPRLLDRRGNATDRNTQLLVPAPFPLPDPHEFGSAIAVTQTSTGAVAVFGTDKTDRVLGPSGTPGGWVAIEGGLCCIAAALNLNGRIELFGVNSAQQIFHRRQDSAGGWSGIWEGFEGQLNSITVARNAAGRLEIFGTNLYDQIFHRAQKQANADDWDDWSQMAGSAVQIAAAPNSIGRIELFALGRDGEVLNSRQTDVNGSSWTPWNHIGGNLNSLAIARNQNGLVEVFGTNNDLILWRKRQSALDSTAWDGWQRIDQPLSFDAQAGKMTYLAVERNAAGLLEMYGVQANGDVLQRQQTAPNATTWTSATVYGIQKLRPNLPDAPDSLSTPPVLRQNINVPRVTGLTPAQAAPLLTGANLTLGRVTQNPQLCEDLGTISSQNPTPGVHPLYPGSGVDVDVAVGNASCGHK